MNKLLLIKNQGIKQFAFLIFLLTFSLGINAQTTISGKVMDKDGPILGVNVSLKGSKVSVTTDFDGTFKIKSEAGNSILVFSFIGYDTKSVAINNLY